MLHTLYCPKIKGPPFGGITNMIKAIDLHCHFNHGAPHDAGESTLHRRGFDFLREEHAAANIIKTVHSSYDAVLSNERICEENEYLLSLTEGYPDIYGWVVVDPRLDDTLIQAERLLRKPKMLGIKVHRTHGYDIADMGDKLFSFANGLGTTVLMHPDRISLMPTFADRYPNMRLIIAHLATEEHIEAVRAARYGNVYTDTSGGDSTKNNILEYAVERIGSEKIYFGTDTYAAGFQYGRVAHSRLSDRDKENILYRNALRDFPGLSN